jgi:uncharacterized membrane protein
MNENESGMEKRIEVLEKRTKLAVILIVCVLAVSAACLAMQFVSPFAMRGGGLGGGDIRSGQAPQDFPQGQSAPETEG